MSQSRAVSLVLIALYRGGEFEALCLLAVLDSCAPLQRSPAGWFTVKLLLCILKAGDKGEEKLSVLSIISQYNGLLDETFYF